MANEPEEGWSSVEVDEGGPVKSFLEHLEDLRWALIKSAAAVAVAVLLCLLAGNYVVHILVRPLEKAMVSYPPENQVVTVMSGTNRLGVWQLNEEQQAAFNLDPTSTAAKLHFDDVTRISSLADRLFKKTDVISSFINSQLDADTSALLNDYQKVKTRQGALQGALVVALNHLVYGPAIYNAVRFKEVKLRKLTTTLLERHPEGRDLARLNRLLLEDAYPRELSRNSGQFVTLELVPTLIDSGTNQVRVLGWNARPNEYGGHMDINLVVLGPSQAFLVGFRLALYAGLAIASPFIFFFLGQFILPALRIREKKYLYRGLCFAIPLFFTGVLFCYFILMPAALAASQIYANWFGFSSNFWEAGEYLGFICKFMLGMGVGFELPVVILILVKIGLLSYSTLKKARPYMIVINLILGAVLTTPEVFTQVLMAIPLQILFEISLFIAWYWERQEKKRAAETAENP